MSIALHGIQYGFLLALLIGPVFFSILQTSLERGFSKAAWLVCGVSLSDALYVLGCYYGWLLSGNTPSTRKWMAVGGGALLIAFGLYHLIVKTRKVMPTAVRALDGQSGWRYLAKGFLLNTLTPTVLLFWMATVTLATMTFGYDDDRSFLLFFIPMLSTVLGADLTKAMMAARLQSIMSPNRLRILHGVLGAALLIFGLRMWINEWFRL